ncbi:MAG: NAD(+)/NADH kinase [Anaerolineae bacterium]
MEYVGLFYNPRVPESLPLAREIITWLAERSVETWLCSTHEQPSEQVCLPETELIITLGGDGTILRSMPLVAPLGIPVLGLNLGRVGFLTECVPENWPNVVRRILAGEGEIEERLMLQATHLRGEEIVSQDFALNDVVLSRGGSARTVHLEAHIDGAPLTTYVADGLILATATGSTAYSYAVGGPILPPWIHNFLLVPVAAHLSLERPLVLNADAKVEVIARTRYPGILTVDGRMENRLCDGDRVRVHRCPLQARFLRLRSRGDFYRTLVKRLTPRNNGE